MILHYVEQASNGCSFFQNSCGAGQSGDLLDQVENYMDYSTDICQNMFTQGQADLMRANTRKFRSGIVAEKEYPLEPEFDRTMLFPNPTTNVLRVSIVDADPQANYTLQIVNLLGQEVGNIQLQPSKYQQIDTEFGIVELIF